MGMQVSSRIGSSTMGGLKRSSFSSTPTRRTGERRSAPALGYAYRRTGERRAGALRSGLAQWREGMTRT